MLPRYAQSPYPLQSTRALEHTDIHAQNNRAIHLESDSEPESESELELDEDEELESESESESEELDDDDELLLLPPFRPFFLRDFESFLLAGRGSLFGGKRLKKLPLGCVEFK